MESLEEIRNFLHINLSPERFKHSLGVESTSVKLARNYGLNPYNCAIAGLSHDICREMSRHEMEKISGQKSHNYVLLHGHAGAEFLQTDFNISNKSIINAVRYHTSGNPGLDDLGKVIFAADYLEPGRLHVSDDERSRLFLLELDDMVLAIANNIKQYLEDSHFVIEPGLGEMILELSKDK